MKKKTKSLVKLVLVGVVPVLLLCVGLPLCLKEKDFSLHKISSSILHYNEEWDAGIDRAQEQELMNRVFNQPFYYLSGGEQTYAFISEDQKYVLKFFKMHRLTPKSWLMSLPSTLFPGYHFNHVQKKIEMLKGTFSGIKLAYDTLGSGTALAYIHLNKTHHLHQKVRVIDKQGVPFTIDLDTTEFLLDKTAVLLRSYFLRLSELGEERRMHRAVRSFIELIAERCKKGLANRDAALVDSYGFIADQAVLIDCGKLSPDPALAYPHNYRSEVARIVEEIDGWAQVNCPAASAVFQEELQHFLILD